MALFEKAKNLMAFLKMGIYGEAGSGKTFTATKVATGLWHYCKAKKPVAFIDTETGSDFVIKEFKAAKVPLVVAKTRSFADLLGAVQEAEKEYFLLIVDSITHFWNELMESYMKKMERKRLGLQDWIPIKQTWREFSDAYVNSKLHIIMNGRAGYVWEDEEDEDGVKELKKTGTKMKAEVETGYEPSLLVEMVKARKSRAKGSGWAHRAIIIKDRFDVIDGKAFDDPAFEAFLPHIELLNLGGEHKALETGRDSTSLFERSDIGAQKYKQKEQLLEKIQNEIYLLYPGQTAAEKKSRLTLLRKIFGTHSWAEITEVRDLSRLSAGLKDLEELEKKESLTPGAGSDKKEEQS